jgi:glycosyltransferase involved in cell wall biosynthesis
MFSVVIPLWNKRATVERAVRSVLEQSFAVDELIVVDDGSTDGGVDALSTVTDTRLRVIRQVNAGPGAARNAGIEAARHDWIAFLDADDLWLPEHLAELDRVRRAHPDSGLIGAATIERRADTPFVVPVQRESRIGAIRYFAEVARIGVPLRTSSAAIPRRTFHEIGGFSDARLGEDSEYWARIALARTVATSSRVTAIYTRGLGGAIESSRGRWHGITSRAALTPAIALIEEHRHAGASDELRRDLDDYVTRYLDWALKALVAEGDVDTLRGFGRLYTSPPTAWHRLLLALARLPRPVARATLRPASRAMTLARRLCRPHRQE